MRRHNEPFRPVLFRVIAMSLSVLIPVKPPEPYLPRVLRRVDLIRADQPGLIDDVLIEKEGSLPEARKVLVKRAESPYVLNLDADTLVPIEFPGEALNLFKRHPGMGAVALNYRPRPQTHPDFSCSVMPTLLMRRTYSWPGHEKSEDCECLFMWKKLTLEGWIVATLPMWAQQAR